MSNFDTAVLTVLKHEGRLVNDVSDPGGITNYGISLRFLQNLEGLKGDFDHDGDVDAEDIKVLSQDDAANLYRLHWWDKYQYERVINQSVATKLLTLSVNMGAISAHKSLQRAIRSSSGVVLLDDGFLGSKSIFALNETNPSELLCAYRSEAAGFYRSLNKPKYINGWLNRAYE